MAVLYLCTGVSVGFHLDICRFLFLSSLLFWPSLTIANDNDLLGFWQTEDKDAVVEFYPCEDSLCGRFYWLEDDSLEHPSLDDRNPDPELKLRPLCGLNFMGGFKPNSDGRYDGGWIYSPRHGTMFSANIALTGHDQLELRGFVFIPLLGGSQTWTRVEYSEACPLLVKIPSS